MGGKSSKNQMDERQRKVIGEAIAYAGVIAFLYEILVIIIKLIQTNDIKTSYTEIGLLVIMSIVVIGYLQVKKEYRLPKTITGKILPVENSKEDKIARIIYYVRDSLRLTIIFLFFTIATGRIIVPISLMGSKTLSYIAQFFIEFITFFIINFVWYEYNVKKYKKHLESLDDNESRI